MHKQNTTLKYDIGMLAAIHHFNATHQDFIRAKKKLTTRK